MKCKKCGCTNIGGPRYKKEWSWAKDYLVYTCQRCGYSWEVPTLDDEEDSSGEENKE